MTGIELIAAERQRQIHEEGHAAADDDDYAAGELADAAACYAMQPLVREPDGRKCRKPKLWPWDAKWWKPTPNNRLRELVKAGALIAAEIDRLQRMPID